MSRYTWNRKTDVTNFQRWLSMGVKPKQREYIPWGSRPDRFTFRTGNILLKNIQFLDIMLIWCVLTFTDYTYSLNTATLLFMFLTVDCWDLMDHLHRTYARRGVDHKSVPFCNLIGQKYSIWSFTWNLRNKIAIAMKLLTSFKFRMSWWDTRASKVQGLSSRDLDICRRWTVQTTPRDSCPCCREKSIRREKPKPHGKRRKRDAWLF